MKTSPALVLTALWAAGLLSAVAGPREVEVNVNVDFTPEGRKLTPPTREHPAYYLPLVGGYRPEDEVAGEKVPGRALVLHEIACALADNGYLVAGPETPLPAFVFAFGWGGLSPKVIEGAGAPVTLNQKQMVALVAGQSVKGLDLVSDREAVIQSAAERRYFVVISAYDFTAAQRGRRLLLWRTKMSTPTSGVDFGEVANALTTSGGPWLGRETTRPILIKQPIERRTSTKLGELKVLEYPEGKPSR